MSAAFRGDEVRHATRRTPACGRTNEGDGSGGSACYLVLMSDDAVDGRHAVRLHRGVSASSRTMACIHDGARTLSGARSFARIAERLIAFRERCTTRPPRSEIERWPLVIHLDRCRVLQHYDHLAHHAEDEPAALVRKRT